MCDPVGCRFVAKKEAWAPEAHLVCIKHNKITVLSPFSPAHRHCEWRILHLTDRFLCFAVCKHWVVHKCGEECSMMFINSAEGEYVCRLTGRTSGHLTATMPAQPKVELEKRFIAHTAPVEEKYDTECCRTLEAFLAYLNELDRISGPVTLDDVLGGVVVNFASAGGCYPPQASRLRAGFFGVSASIYAGCWVGDCPRGLS